MSGDPKAVLEPTAAEYVKRIMADGGSILGMNTIGVATIVTAYRSLGLFETVVWVSPQQGGYDVENHCERYVSGRISYWPTLELSEAFHCAMARKLWTTAYGKSTSDRAFQFRTATVEGKKYIDTLFKYGSGAAK